MSNHSHQDKNNLLKGIGTLCIFIIFGYYIYQDAMNRMKLGKSLNENATPPQREFSRESSQLQCSPAIHENAADKIVTRKCNMQYPITRTIMILSTNIWMNILQTLKMKSPIRPKSMMH